ncbi:MAG: YbaB/EbfC family nucleoid-associated protein [Clostridia bacterium]|nr:YbaB/EbfC family nucleoid-associated protein [Clostridia bacterium]
MAKSRIPMGMGGNMNNMIKQAQKMQQNMLKMQEEIEKEEFEASAGGGAVTVKMSGKKELLSVSIKPEAADPDDVEMLEDLILTAVNDVLGKVDAANTSKMSSITGGLNIPGMF